MNTLPEVLGKYQIKKVLGQGAMGIVYQGFDPIIERTVAIKVLHSHHCQGEHGSELTQRFRREAQAAARCLHNNIVTIFDYGTYQEQDYIVMEYVEGEELSHFLNSRNELSVDEAIFITISVLQALHAAHQHNIVHRDIKPANIILLNNGGVKVADFGVALLDQSDLTMVGNMVGTPNYMSPQGLRGEIVTQQADIYSTGMVLLEMLTGARLTPQQLYTLPIKSFVDQVFVEHHSVDPRLQKIIHQALAADTSERFAQASEFLAALENLSSAEQNINATVTAKKAIQEKSKTLIKLPKQTLLAIESNLTGYLGPIATILIKKTSANATSAKDFMLSLAKHISNEAEREKFIEQATITLEQEMYKEQLSATLTPNNTTNTDNTNSHGDTTNSHHAQTKEPEQADIPPAKLQELTQSLAFYLGPLARHHVKRQQLSAHNYQSLCAQLAALIPNSDERAAFLKKVE